MWRMMRGEEGAVRFLNKGKGSGGRRVYGIGNFVWKWSEDFVEGCCWISKEGLAHRWNIYRLYVCREYLSFWGRWTTTLYLR